MGKSEIIERSSLHRGYTHLPHLSPRLGKISLVLYPRPVTLPGVMTPNDKIEAVAKEIRFEAEGQKFICINEARPKLFGKDVKYKRSKAGYWVVRLSIDGELIEVYCHALLWFLTYGKVASAQIRFAGSKDDLSVENLLCADRTTVEREEKARITVRACDLAAAMKALANAGIFAKCKDSPTEAFFTATEVTSDIYPIDCWFL